MCSAAYSQYHGCVMDKTQGKGLMMHACVYLLCVRLLKRFVTGIFALSLLQAPLLKDRLVSAIQEHSTPDIQLQCNCDFIRHLQNP